MKKNVVRWDIINKLIKYYGYQRYLEIGVKGGQTFNNINCKNKISVDPFRPATYNMTSDEFFKKCPEDEKWDIVFIDGLHEREQVKRDITNSLKHLNENGTIVCHDMCPPFKEHLRVRYCHNSWEAFAYFRKTNKDLEMYVVNTNCGCGVIRKGNQTLYDSDISSDWEFFDENKKEILNLISVEEFNERYDK